MSTYEPQLPDRQCVGYHCHCTNMIQWNWDYCVSCLNSHTKGDSFIDEKYSMIKKFKHVFTEDQQEVVAWLLLNIEDIEEYDF